MCRNRVDFAAIESRFDVDFAERFRSELMQLRALASDSLIELDDGGFTITPRGRLLLRVIAMVFDVSFRRAQAAPRGYSRVI